MLVEIVSQTSIWGLNKVRNAYDVLLNRLIVAVADSADYKQLLNFACCQRLKIFLYSCAVLQSLLREVEGEKSRSHYSRLRE